MASRTIGTELYHRMLVKMHLFVGHARYIYANICERTADKLRGQRLPENDENAENDDELTSPKMEIGVRTDAPNIITHKTPKKHVMIFEL